jgi:small multidrug resistance pump
MPEPALSRYSPWFYAAAVYNLLWGALNVLFPAWYFHFIRMPLEYSPLWQVVGMMVGVYALAYWWTARHPERYPHFIIIGLLGKILGPIGFVWSCYHGRLPLIFGLTILTNDLIWWPAFGLYLRDSARLRGGWAAMLRGE